MNIQACKETAPIGDIVVSRIIFAGDRFRTASQLASCIRNFLEENHVADFFSELILVDIPASTNRQDEQCLAFVRFDDPADHRLMVEKFNSRIDFRGKRLVLRSSCEAPRQMSEYYIQNELALRNDDQKRELEKFKKIRLSTHEGENSAARQISELKFERNILLGQIREVERSWAEEKAKRLRLEQRVAELEGVTNSIRQLLQV